MFLRPDIEVWLEQAGAVNRCVHRIANGFQLTGVEFFVREGEGEEEDTLN